MITVYGTPRCQQCVMTQKRLESLGIAYTKVDVSQDADALSLIKSMGYSTVPVIVDGDRHWSGFDPEKIALCQK